MPTLSGFGKLAEHVTGDRFAHRIIVERAAVLLDFRARVYLPNLIGTQPERGQTGLTCPEVGDHQRQEGDLSLKKRFGQLTYRMEAVPLHLREANEFVAKYHQHNRPTVGGRSPG